jgi:hypothetical protein
MGRKHAHRRYATTLWFAVAAAVTLGAMIARITR